MRKVAILILALPFLRSMADGFDNLHTEEEIRLEIKTIDGGEVPTAPTKGNCDPQPDGNNTCALGEDEIKNYSAYESCRLSCKTASCASDCLTKVWVK